ncbi:MAG: RHS repeat-associated core domain-containing protein, partial [Blastocatellia bacterium]
HLPFGEDFGESGTQEKHHFTSYERDGESGLDYAVNRGYSPNVGRFQQADPYKASGYLFDPQSWNRYSYARNNATNRVDLLGLDDDDPIVLRGWAYYDREYGNSFNGSRGDDIEIERPADPTTGDGTITAPLPGNLRERLRRKLEKNNNECGNFVHALITQVAGDTGMNAYSVDALDLFDAISAQRGYVLQQAVVNGENVDGTVRGGLTNPASPATVIISPKDHAGSPFNENAVQNYYTHVALHETIHLANSQGVYSDSRLADAVFNLGGLSDDLREQYHNIKTDSDASTFWDKVLEQHCPRLGGFEQ